MTDPAGENPHPSRWRTRRYRLAALALVVVVLGGGAWWMHRVAQQRLRAQLLQAAPDAVIGHADLVAVAMSEARPLYSKHCAGCHGADLHGNPSLGAPDLADQVWLYGRGSVFDIERTVLYGIRAGMAKTRDVTEMPAFGLTGMLTPDEIRNLVQYVLQLSGAKHDPQGALAGRQVYPAIPTAAIAMVPMAAATRCMARPISRPMSGTTAGMRRVSTTRSTTAGTASCRDRSGPSRWARSVRWRSTST